MSIVVLVGAVLTGYTSVDSLKRKLLSYSVFDFIFFLIFRFWAVR